MVFNPITQECIEKNLKEIKDSSDHHKSKIKEFPNKIKEFSFIWMSHKIKEK